MRVNNKRFVQSLALSALALAVSAVYAEGTKDAGAQYQSAESPLATVEMHQNINPKAPAMTENEFNIGKNEARKPL